MVGEKAVSPEYQLLDATVGCDDVAARAEGLPLKEDIRQLVKRRRVELERVVHPGIAVIKDERPVDLQFQRPADEK